MIVIDKTFAADGDSAVFAWQGGEGVFTGVGTFGGGTATLRFSYDGSTYSNVGSDTTITASGGGIFGYLHPCLMKVTLSGSTAPALTVKVAKND